MTEKRPGMTDEEILTLYRQDYSYISLGDAKACYCTWLRFCHLGAPRNRAEKGRWRP